MCPLQKKNPILLLSLSVVVSKKKKNKKKNEIARADVKTFFFPLFLAGGAISLSLSLFLSFSFRVTKAFAVSGRLSFLFLPKWVV
jgi:hypothetical protein